jgi:hypothetical protein
MKRSDLILDVLCISIPIGILVVSAILGIRMRIRSAREIQAKLDQGHYSNLMKHNDLSRARLVAAVQISVLLVILLMIILWFMYPDQETRITLTCIFGLTLLLLTVLEIVRIQLMKNK